MSGRGYRRPYVRQRRESDEGEEEGFLYCLMYYFDEARRESEDGGDRRARRSRRYCEEDEGQASKKKDDEDDEEMLNPLVYRETLSGRSRRGGMMRRAYTPDRDALSRSTAAAASLRSRSHSQPPEINHNDVSRRQRKKK
ncbi:uncharacterized protein LOC121879507 [Homarus americanus]|uniref:uncharacterized protein LOC121879507 n=1 Tax=Homarus americanus TaxID=6706 RepID=UPI001C495CA0|nr:uncharacterized protein LOC121879507 [Homarus americanus]